jgi:hypothetical protein
MGCLLRGWNKREGKKDEDEQEQPETIRREAFRELVPACLPWFRTFRRSTAFSDEKVPPVPPNM